MNIILLKNGDSLNNLYLIQGLNSKNGFNEWEFDQLNFPGKILGLEWDNFLPQWDIFKNGSIEEIKKKLVVFDFIKNYNRVCMNADATGKFLASEISENEKNNNFIIAHSMGSRAAFHYLMFSKNSNINNQILIFNGAISNSKKLHDFNKYKNKSNKGVINFYNPDDKVLSLLPILKNLSISIIIQPFEYLSSIDPIKDRIEQLKKILFKSKTIKKSYEAIKLLNELYNFDEVGNFFDPIGLNESKTVPNNICITKVQKNGHSIDHILNKIVSFDEKENDFKITI